MIRPEQRILHLSSGNIMQQKDIDINDIQIHQTVMTTEEIRALLNKFYAAETSAEEESALKAFFRGGDVPAEWQDDKAFFCQLFTAEEQVPEGMESRLNHAIDTWNTVEKTGLRKARIISMRWIAGVAAALFLIFSLSLYLNHRQTAMRSLVQTDTETYDNPKDAMGETERALTKFSLAINKGLDKMNLETHRK